MRPGAAVRLATCGPLGYFPIGPGSVGAALGLGIIVALGLTPLPRVAISAIIGAMAIGVLFLGVKAATEAERHFRRKDPGHVVIDEVLGQMITLAMNPRPGWKGLVIAYVIFRAFDVIKPFPARRLEHLPGGWGIMLDDAAAGVWSLIAFSLVWEFWLK